MNSRGWMRIMALILVCCRFAPAKEFGPKEAEEISLASDRSKKLASDRDAFRKEYLERLQLDPRRDSCLANDIHSGSCLIPLSEFNSALGAYVPDSIPGREGASLTQEMTKTRTLLLAALLESAYLNGLPSGPSGTSRDPQKAPHGKMRKPTKTDRKEKIPFAFGLVPALKIQGFASSDSAWLADRLEDPRKGILPSTASAAELPESLLVESVELEARAWTAVRKTSFGFLSISLLDPGLLGAAMEYVDSHWDRFRPRDAIAMQKAVDSALSLATSPCISRDTLEISLRLSPQIAHNPGPNGAPGPNWIRTTSIGLPKGVTDVLLRKNSRPGDTLGPFQGPFGKWRMAVVGRRPGAEMPIDVCGDGLKSRILERERLEFLKSGFQEARMKSRKPPGTIYAEFIQGLEAAGDGSPELTYKRRRDEWISKSVRINHPL